MIYADWRKCQGMRKHQYRRIGDRKQVNALAGHIWTCEFQPDDICGRRKCQGRQKPSSGVSLIGDHAIMKCVMQGPLAPADKYVWKMRDPNVMIYNVSLKKSKRSYRWQVGRWVKCQRMQGWKHTGPSRYNPTKCDHLTDSICGLTEIVRDTGWVGWAALSMWVKP